MKTSMVLLLALAMVAAVSAAGDGIGSIDDECRAIDDDYYGIAKWEYGGGGYSLADEREGYDTSVVGTGYEASWTSSPPAIAVLTKEDKKNIYEWSGGSSGDVYYSGHEISHITLCGMGSDGGGGCTGDGCNGVPEFSWPALLVAVVLTGAGIIYLRKA